MGLWQRFATWRGWPWSPGSYVGDATAAALQGTFWAPRGEPVDMAGTKDDAANAGPQWWQTRAWQLWKPVGELHAPTSYIARIISRRINWRAEDPAWDSEKTASELQNALGATNLEEFVRLVVLNMQVAGDMWVVQEEDRWNVLAVTDRNLKKRVSRARAAGRVAQRVYDPDPECLDHADSAFISVLAPAEELLILSALQRAQSRSRIAQAGILIVPAEQQFEGGDPFGQTLEDAMTAGIRDVSSPAAVVPIKATMAADLIEKVRHLTFDRPYDDKIPEKIERATRRIALGLDVPPELLLGLGENSSHWGAWAVKEETYQGTTAPLAEKTAAVLELVLRTYLNTDSAPQIIPDPTELLARRSTTRDAFEGARLGAVGLGYVREAMGASDLDKPTTEDIAIIQSLASRGRSAADDAARDQVQEPPQQGDPQSNPAA